MPQRSVDPGGSASFCDPEWPGAPSVVGTSVQWVRVDLVGVSASPAVGLGV